LIHISEISDDHIAHPKEVLHEGDEVTLRIIKIEPESHRIGLSLRRVESLAFADMDLKELEKELDDASITVTSDETDEEEGSAEPEAAEDVASEDNSEETAEDEVVEEPESETETESEEETADDEEKEE
jgi:small subunit ribosomal protein S1